MVLPSLVVAGVGQEDVSANPRRTARSRYHFFCNDDLAQGALMQAPRQGVAAGFNDLGGSDQMLPMLTIVRAHRAQIGRTAPPVLLLLLTCGKLEEPSLVDLGLWAGGAREHLKHLLRAVAVMQIDDATRRQQAHSRSRPTRVFDRISRHEVQGGKRRLSLASNAAPTSNLPLWSQQRCPASA